MNWEVEFREVYNFVKVATSGKFTLEDHLSMIEDIVSRGFWKPGMDVFFDNRELHFVNTDIETMRRASANHQQNNKRIGDGKTAILMKSLPDFGRGRQFELLSSGKISAKLKIFLEEENAVEWLCEKA
ncbi:MAG TPA: hypothetical protein PKY59_13855 [Pyrinomonadaceae bacterium]|nr:hypothetical protein [Pyrinomonadaceae bacterium]